MAVVFSNNATTVLSSNITNSATSIAVQDGSVFPTLSGTDYFYATLQDPGNTKREIVKVTARSGNTLTVTRAVDGSSASAFSANDAFELRLNAAALNDAVNSGTADLELNSFTGDGSEVDFTLSMEALEANTLVYIDGVYQNKTAYSISGYVLTFSAAPDNGAAIEVTTATVAPIQESTDFLLNQFTGDGSDTTFTLSSSPEENQTTVFISGVYQSKSNYSISGTTLTFSTAPPASSSIEVMVARTVVYGIGTPSNDTVSTAKIVDGAVTPAKLSLTYATETYVGTAVSNLVDSSPAALDTLNELAAALGDDPNFATTVTNSIALKAPLASPSFTGTATMDGLTSTTSSSMTQLTVNGTGAIESGINFASGGTTYGQIYFNNVSPYDMSVLQQYSTGSLIFGTNDTERMRIDSSGRVGIGTSSPASPTGFGSSGILHLKGATGNDCSIVLEGLSGSGGRQEIGASGGALQFYRGAATGSMTESMRIDSSGNVGIGCSPSKPLHLKYSSGWATMRLEGASDSGGELEFYKGSTKAGAIFFDNSNNLNIRTGNTERMRIDSSGNVGIANSSLSNWASGYNALQVGGKAFFAAHSSSDSYFGQNAYINSGWKYASTAAASFIQQSGGKIQFYVAPSGTADSAISWTNAVEIDNSGNLLVGTTVTDTAAVGFRYRSSLDAISSVADGGVSAYFGRRSSFGDIVTLRKDDATVGNIGTPFTGELYIAASGANSSGLLLTESNAVRPMKNGSASDATQDLGRSNGRWKDLYLSGGVYLGGTGAANKLDDYEEGTFTPTVTTNNGTISTSAQQGTYVKVGDVVHYWIRVVATCTSTAVLYNVDGLPFSTAAYSGFYAGPTIANSYHVSLGTNATVLGGYYLNNTNSIRLHSYGNNTNQLSPSVTANTGFELRFEGSYRLTA